MDTEDDTDKAMGLATTREEQEQEAYDKIMGIAGRPGPYTQSPGVLLGLAAMLGADTGPQSREPIGRVVPETGFVPKREEPTGKRHRQKMNKKAKKAKGKS